MGRRRNKRQMWPEEQLVKEAVKSEGQADDLPASGQSRKLDESTRYQPLPASLTHVATTTAEGGRSSIQPSPSSTSGGVLPPCQQRCAAAVSAGYTTGIAAARVTATLHCGALRY